MKLYQTFGNKKISAFDLKDGFYIVEKYRYDGLNWNKIPGEMRCLSQAELEKEIV